MLISATHHHESSHRYAYILGPEHQRPYYDPTPPISSPSFLSRLSQSAGLNSLRHTENSLLSILHMVIVYFQLIFSVLPTPLSPSPQPPTMVLELLLGKNLFLQMLNNRDFIQLQFVWFVST